MNRFLALCLSLALLMSIFAGCTTTPDNTPSTTPPDNQGSTDNPPEEGSKNPLEEPGEMSFLVIQQAGAPLSPDMPALQELSKRTNTKLTYTNIPQADMSQRVETLVAANQLPDAVEYYPGDGGSNAQTLLSEGIFIGLENYLSEELTPNLMKLFQEYPEFKRDITTDDGVVMGIAQATTRKWRCDWIINNTFLKELNMEAPDDLDSLYEYLKAVKEKYPDAVPMGVGPWAGDRNAIIRSIMYIFNVTNEWWLYNDDQYLFGPWEKQEEYKAALKYTNQLYSEGLIDPAFFSISAEETNAKISNNQVGILYGWDDGYGTWGADGTWGVDYVPCTPIAGPDGTAYVRGNARMALQTQYITKNCKDVERALAFYDYCFSEEGVDLLNWGLEGTDYTVVNGERQYTDLIMKHESGYVIGRYAQGLAHPRIQTVIDGDVELLVNGKETKQHVENMSLPYVKLFPSIPQLTPTAEEEAAYNLIYTEISPVYKEYEANLITGSPDDFDKLFDEYMAKLEALGIEEMCKIKHAQYERYKVR